MTGFANPLPAIIMLSISLACIIVYSVIGTTSAFSQTDDVQDVQRQQREALSRQNELRKQAPDGQSSRNRPDASRGKDSFCFPIDKIELSGAHSLTVSEVKKVTAPFEGKCLGLNLINNIVRDLTYLYIDQGLIAARVYIPEQDLGTRDLKLAALEGHLERIDWPNAKENGLNSRIATAFPNMVGKPLQLRDIEQGLDQIRRMQSSKVSNRVAPGKKPGQSVLAVDEQNTRRFFGSVTMHNKGQKNTGFYSTNAYLGINNLLQLNDVWSLNFERNSPGKLFDYDAPTHYSHSVSGSLSIPFGYWTTSISGSWNNYDNDIAGLLSTVDTNGYSAQAEATLSRVIHRDSKSKTSLSGALTWKQTENYLLGVRLDTASRNLSIASVNLDHTRRMWGGVWTGNAGYFRGLRAFGAPEDDARSNGFPKAQFDKLTLAVSANYDFSVGSNKFSYTGSVSGQWSDDLLFGSEQFSLGGFYSVQGVRSGVSFGNIGVLSRHELSAPLAVPAKWSGGGIVEKILPYAGVDFGWVIGQDQFEIKDDFLLGGTIGLRAQGRKLSLDLSWSDIFYSRNAIQDSGVFSATATLKF